MQWLYLYLPQLQLDRLQALAPELANSPFVLYQEQNRLQPLVQLNPLAKRAGLSESMPLARAWLLEEELQPKIWNALEQKRLLQQLCTYLYQHFSDIYLDPPDGLWLNLQPMRRVYLNEHDWQQVLASSMKVWQSEYRIAQHSAPAAARLLARYAVDKLSLVKVEQLGFEPVLLEKVKRLGLSTLADLQRYSRAELGQKLGRSLVELLAQLEGHQQLRLEPYQPPSLFYQKLVLPAEVKQWQGLQFALKRALKELELFLRHRKCVATQLTLRLYYREAETTTIYVGMPHGASKANEIFALCQLKASAVKLADPVLELSVQAKGLQPAEEHAQQLWGGTQKSAVPLLQVLNQLKLRLGESRVKGLASAEHWLPELAWQEVACGQPSGAPSVAYRPPWLCQDPQRTALAEWQLIQGPERIRVPWWFAGRKSFERDYYHGIHLSGRRGWIFYCYAQQQWWLHGWFS